MITKLLTFCHKNGSMTRDGFAVIKGEWIDDENNERVYEAECLPGEQVISVDCPKCAGTGKISGVASSGQPGEEQCFNCNYGRVWQEKAS